MRFEYTYRNTGVDLWQLSMYYTYGSMVGVCNVIFTAAVWILTGIRWGEAGAWMRAALVFGCIKRPDVRRQVLQKTRKSFLTREESMWQWEKSVLT